jgi:hypothetical protein
MELASRTGSAARACARASVLAWTAVFAPVSESTAPPTDTIVTDSSNPRWLFRADGSPLFICGPGDPEGFFFRGSLLPDGTRAGDQDALIEKMAGTGANCLYLMAVRSHGGDGDATQNPFVDNVPSAGLNDAVLDQWETWLSAMDDAGIVAYLFLYDDSTIVWNTGDAVGAAEEAFVRALVDRFEHHANLVWCVAEEYSEALSVARASALADILRDADDFDHPIAVHQRMGLSFDFPGDPNVDQFAIQYNVTTATALHDGMVTAWQNAAGQYALNMSEASGFGTGAESRRKAWACAMGGSYVMILGMDVASTPLSDLRDCGRLVDFFESTGFVDMEPADDLAHGATDWVLAAESGESILYAADPAGEMGRRSLSAGSYALRWFDCATGATVEQTGVSVPGGDVSWSIPAGLGSEIAVHVVPEGLTAIQEDRWGTLKARYRPE